MRFWHNGNEFTKKVSKYASGSFELNYESGDYLYVASEFPFNHFWIRVLIGSLSTAEMSVDYYSNGWNSVVDIQDETLGLSADGFVEFTPNKQSHWQKKDSQDLGLSFVCYDRYWLRISFDSPLEATLDFIGSKFSDDTDLYSEFPVFDSSDYKTAFKTGKTDWDEQHVRAAELVVQDLKKKNIIFGGEQILSRDILTPAAIQKTAEIIYNGFGNDFVNQKEQARTEYARRLDLSQFSTDVNNDGILSQEEAKNRQQWLGR